jgi:hypothetical protein
MDTMPATNGAMTEEFLALVEAIPKIGRARHAATLIGNARENSSHVRRSVKALPPLKGPKATSGIVLSAGPSLMRRNSIQRILNSEYRGTVICVDGAYSACLKEGLVPDFVVTLDPHPTRTVRWFGDPDFEKNSENDDYFARQDLDLDFRKNSLAHNRKNIELVNHHLRLSWTLVSSCSSPNLVERLIAAEGDLYGFNPLVDDPNCEESLTRQMHKINGLPCINTGGTVGTAAWVFAATFLRLPSIGVLGMDFGYPADRPLRETQTYFELADRLGTDEGIEKYFAEFTFPLTGEKFYTDPTYFWYRQSFLDLLPKAKETVTVNCTEGGTLVDGIACVPLEAFLGGRCHFRGDSLRFGGQVARAS